MVVYMSVIILLVLLHIDNSAGLIMSIICQRDNFMM